MAGMMRRSLLSICLLIFGFGTTGCELGRTMFQMDSNSGMPNFSFDLIPRKSKKKSIREIAHKEDVKAEVIPTIEPKQKRSVFGWTKKSKEEKSIPLALPEYNRSADKTDEWTEVPVEDF